MRAWGRRASGPVWQVLATWTAATGSTGYVFAGLQGRAVAHNIFLDGNTFSGSLRVRKRHIVADAQAGLVVSCGGLRFSYTLVRRSREFATQQDPHYFAAFSLTARY